MQHPPEERHRHPRLVGVELGRMDVDEARPALAAEPLHRPPHEPVGQHPQPEAAGERHPPQREAEHRRRELEQPPSAGRGQAEGRAGGRWDAVEVRLRRVDARVVVEALLGDDVECPDRARRYGPVGRAIAADGRAGLRAQDVEPAAEVRAELVGREVVDEAMGVAVAGDLVARGLHGRHDLGVHLGYVAEDEERAPGPLLGEAGEQTLGGRPHAVLVLRPVGGLDLEDRVVPVLDVHRQRVRQVVVTGGHGSILGGRVSSLLWSPTCGPRPPPPRKRSRRPRQWACHSA